MASTAEGLNVDTGFEPRTGERVDIVEGIARVTAPNRGPFTFTGTNSFLVGVDRLMIIDAGPNHSRHLEALMRAIGDRPVEAILLTHTHRDHSGLARRLAARTRAPIWFGGPHRLYRDAGWLERQRLARSCDFRLVPDEVLADGDTITIDGIGLGVMATPGHCANHLSFSIAGTPYLFTGDHIMGWSSTLVAPPDGSMTDYLNALEDVIVSPFSYYLPAHGGPVPEGRRYARALMAHRRERDRQILAALAEGADSVTRLVGRIYPEIAPALRPAAAMTVRAHLDHLERRGLVAVERRALGRRYSAVGAAVPSGDAKG